MIFRRGGVVDKYVDNSMNIYYRIAGIIKDY